MEELLVPCLERVRRECSRIAFGKTRQLKQTLDEAIAKAKQATPLPKVLRRWLKSCWRSRRRVKKCEKAWLDATQKRPTERERNRERGREREREREKRCENALD
eukprot:scaffold642_cov232-Pinguiococcus_pyrenoidosus.AAC.9